MYGDVSDLTRVELECTAHGRPGQTVDSQHSSWSWEMGGEEVEVSLHRFGSGSCVTRVALIDEFKCDKWSVMAVASKRLRVSEDLS